MDIQTKREYKNMNIKIKENRLFTIELLNDTCEIKYDNIEAISIQKIFRSNYADITFIIKDKINVCHNVKMSNIHYDFDLIFELMIDENNQLIYTSKDINIVFVADKSTSNPTKKFNFNKFNDCGYKLKL